MLRPMRPTIPAASWIAQSFLPPPPRANSGGRAGATFRRRHTRYMISAWHRRACDFCRISSALVQLSLVHVSGVSVRLS